jgi:PhnB protein
MKLPEGYQAIMPYLLLEDTNGFLDFTVKVFNATVKENRAGQGGKIVHGEVLIGGSCIMFGPAGGHFKPQPAGMFVYVENADHTYQVALDAGATSVMGLSDQSYGRTCGVLDPYGNTWWITSVQ